VCAAGFPAGRGIAHPFDYPRNQIDLIAAVERLWSAAGEGWRRAFVERRASWLHLHPDALSAEEPDRPYRDPD
jgi:hypothetical protein